MSMSKVSWWLWPIALAAMVLSFSAYALPEMNMRVGVTPLSHEMHHIHMMILTIITVVGVLVATVMLYTVISFRKSKGAKPADFHENTTLEVVWTAIPLVVLVLMGIPATKALLAIEDTSNPDMTIMATGYQWKWKYDYLDQKVSYFSNLNAEHNKARAKNSGIDVTKIDNYLLDVDNPLVVPVNKKVRILTTSNDVIHAWWMPDLGVKRDAVPGFINESWFMVEKEGTYRGQCAELCGKDHGFMPIVVVAKNEKDFSEWVAMKQAEATTAAAGSSKTWTHAELLKLGEEKYGTTCAACHMPNGEGNGPFPPLKGSKIATGPVEAHISRVLKGIRMMPSFAAQLSDTDLAAIITYERNSWGNNTGSTVQPSDVKALR